MPQQCVELALQNDWFVEVHGWEGSMSQLYYDIAVRYPDTMRVCLLDDHAKDLIVPSFAK